MGVRPTKIEKPRIYDERHQRWLIPQTPLAAFDERQMSRVGAQALRTLMVNLLGGSLRAQVKDVPVSAIGVTFFSAQNLGFQVVEYGPGARPLLDPNGDWWTEPESPMYAIAVVRYPVLYLDVDALWKRTRYRYFMHHGGAEYDWPHFRRHGVFVLPRPSFDPKHYQDVDRGTEVVQDAHGRWTVLHAPVIGLPRRWTHEGARERGIDTSVYYVNGIEDDPDVVYKALFEPSHEAEQYDDMALFRLNAEEIVSRWVVQERQGLPFFRFRQTANAPYPFKAYLAAYAGARARWRGLWRDRYDLDDRSMFHRYVQRPRGQPRAPARPAPRRAPPARAEMRENDRFLHERNLRMIAD